MLIRITAPHFVAGIDYDKSFFNKGSKCAPIVKYMKHWDRWEIKKYCKKKGWKFEILKDMGLK